MCGFFPLIRTVQNGIVSQGPQQSERALNEANPEYPVPRLVNRRECEALVRKMLCQ